MQIPLQITVNNMPRSDALEARIREKVAELERFHPRITSCRVTLNEFRKHHRQGRQFEVRIDVRVPGHGEIVSNRHHDEDVYVALRDALASTTRQLEEIVRERRGETKHHETSPAQGSTPDESAT
ncbi:MAG TPA: ribosome-associated translation inhibitor RaiA [Casimicrobiaceae bacterium]|nr:ribosome-associated translation inhibitor RaiA [Casimicrobiaceae bacterium]